jgi:hypothetical protein
VAADGVRRAADEQDGRAGRQHAGGLAGGDDERAPRGGQRRVAVQREAERLAAGGELVQVRGNLRGGLAGDAGQHRPQFRRGG